jgi:hypothetical protein
MVKKPTNVIHNTNKMKCKNHTIFLTEAKKVFDKIQQIFMTKTLNRLGIEGINFNAINTIYNKPDYHHTQ